MTTSFEPVPALVRPFHELPVAFRPRGAWAKGHTRRKKSALLARLRFVLLFLAGALLALVLGKPTIARGQELGAARLEVVSQAGDTQGLPLVSETLRVMIERGHAQTTVSQVFQNEGARDVEGLYSIQLGTAATATGFRYWNGAQKIVGEIFEREAATAIYETLTGSGRDPGLLERTGEGCFSFRVAPIAPGEKKRIELELAHWLRRRENSYEYRIPLSASGKIELTIQGSHELRRFTSPTHEIEVTGEDTSFLVRALRRTQPGAEFILRYEVAEPDWHLGASVHADSGEAAYVVVELAAPGSVKPLTEGRDVTLVLDRSGSMSGEPLAAARRAARGILSRLPAPDRVNVIAFDDGVESLFPAPREVTQARKEALAFVDGIREGGGTDIARALEESFARRASKPRAEVLLFLTDGQSDTAAALRAAQKAAPSVRLYTVGIGAGVDRPLLTRLAREHRGSFTFILDDKNIERDVAALYDSIQAPVLTDLSWEIEGARASALYPRTLPDLFQSGELRFALRLTPEPGSRAATLKLKGRRGNETKELSTTVELSPRRAPWVGRAWALARTDDLLERIALDGETPELKKEAVELALAYDLVTPYTSFLALPEAEVTDEVRGTLEEERARKQRVLALHKDAARLSRSVMPPGDPVISVRAERSARRVTASFPFGLELELHYDEIRELWQGRFLVPHDVADGSYSVRIQIVDRDGNVRLGETPYVIDSRAPDVHVDMRHEGGQLVLRVTGDEKLREVRARVTRRDARAGGAPLCPAGGCLFTRRGDAFELTLPAGEYEVRLVAADEARNEAALDLLVSGASRRPTVLPSSSGADRGPTLLPSSGRGPLELPSSTGAAAKTLGEATP